MPVALLVARLLLGAVFLIAGLAKIADQPGTRRSLATFDVPSRLTAPIGVLLPLVELSIAMCLFAGALASLGAIAALVLLTAFTARVGINLARGQTPDCHCFGRWQAEPIGWSTIVRNVCFIALGGLIVSQGPQQPGFSYWLARPLGVDAVITLAGVAMVGTMLLFGWTTLHLVRMYGRLLLRVEALEEQRPPTPTLPLSSRASGSNGTAGAELKLGTPAPQVWCQDIRGGRVQLPLSTPSGTSRLLIFLNPHCAACKHLLPKIASWQREYSLLFSISIVSQYGIDVDRWKLSRESVFYADDTEILRTFGVAGTPAALFVRPDGCIGSRLAAGSAEISAMVVRQLEVLAAFPHRPAAQFRGGQAIEPPLGRTWAIASSPFDHDHSGVVAQGGTK